jgi:hypothetical protein
MEMYYVREYILICRLLNIINSTLTDLVIMLFKSTINVYSPVRNTRNLDLSLFLI